MARLFSTELIEHAIRACNADPDHVERAKLLTGQFIVRALDAPGGMDICVTYAFDGGRCTDYRLEEAAAPSP